jgi:C1A family cysteine protease
MLISGNCTSEGIGDAHMFAQLAQRLPAFMPSHLFIYYNERAMEGTVSSDSGAQIRDGIKSIASQGVCPETMWLYNIAKFKTKPTSACYAVALRSKALLYQRVGYADGTVDLSSLQQAIASMKHPVVFGMPVYAGFESAAVAKTGIVPMPKKGEQLLGGHCMICYGWILIKGQLYLIVKNSWDVTWGDRGWCYLPAAYMAYMSDAWLVSQVMNAAAVKCSRARRK